MSYTFPSKKIYKDKTGNLNNDTILLNQDLNIIITLSTIIILDFMLITQTCFDLFNSTEGNLTLTSN